MYAAEPYRTAIKIQRRMAADVQDSETTPVARAQLARAWAELEKLKRLMKMKPAPKPIDTTLAKPRAPRARPTADFHDDEKHAFPRPTVPTPPTHPPQAATVSESSAQ